MSFSQIFRNTFEGGLNQDVDRGLVEPNQYVDAIDVSLLNEGKFLAIEPLKGSVALPSQSAINGEDPADIRGMMGAHFLFDSLGYKIPMLVIWFASGKIMAVGESTGVYELYSGDAWTDAGVLDAVLYAESGVDIIYFTTGEGEVKKLKCQIPDPYSANFLNEFDVSLARRGALGQVSLVSISSGGNLLSGTYQFAYQAVDPEKNLYTKWSLLTNPVHVYTSSNTGDIVTSGVGLPTNFKIVLNVQPTTEESVKYTHFRLAVIENIYPNDTVNTTAVVTALTEWSGGTGYSYTRSPNYDVIDVSELTIDFQPIESVRTVAIKDNRLLLGGINYVDLSYDNPGGDPSVTAGSILRYGYGPLVVGPQPTTHGNPFGDHDFASRYVGHWRDEVYRYGISYFDKWGNFSPVKALDMTNVSRNQSSQSGFKDMKFPSRRTYFGGDAGLSYTPFLASGGSPQSLGLNITVDKHPTWARGFVIVRAKRIKNILFQSPFVPMGTIQGTGALQNYPSKASEGNAAAAVTYVDPNPMAQSLVLHPTNLFRSGVTSIIQDNTNSGGRYLNEVKNVLLNSTQYFMLFPPAYLSNNKQEDLSGYKISTVDAALLSVEFNNNTIGLPGGVDLGDFIDTDMSGTFYALNSIRYYCSPSFVATRSAIRSSDLPIKGSVFLNNYDEGKKLNGLSVEAYDTLQTKEGGIVASWGYTPTACKAAVVDMGSKINYINNLGITFDNSQVAVASANAWENKYDTQTAVHPNYPNIVEIVNVVGNLGDDRYGAKDARHEYVSTGAIYTFTDGELATVEAGSSLPKSIDVWGGDCFVGYKIFKTCDRQYSVTNAQKTTGGPGTLTVQQTADRWKRAYLDVTNTVPLRLPVAVKGSAQYVQVVIESEENPSVTDVESLSNDTDFTPSGATTGAPVLEATTTEAALTPLTYNYNNNLSKQNDNKLFFNKDPFAPELLDLNSRILYSDLKVYQTTIQGFDLFRINNQYDLNESYGALNKLIVNNDRLYAIQDRAIHYIPVGERVLETSDALTLQVGSGVFINTPITLSNVFGAQFVRAVVNGTGGFYLWDAVAGSVLRVSGDKLALIDNGIASTLRSIATNAVSLHEMTENQIFLGFDAIRKELIVNYKSDLFGVTPGGSTYVYNEQLDKWISSWSFAPQLYACSSLDNGFYLAGNNGSNESSVELMHRDLDGVVLGITTTPSVTYVVNPAVDQPKVYDNIIITSYGKPLSITNAVMRDGILADLGNTVSLSPVIYNEGNYETKLLLDNSTGQRLRGQFLATTISLDPSFNNTLRSVITKYRPSRTL